MDELHRACRIGQLEVSNRLVMSPMLLPITGQDGEVTENLINHYVARAKGGIGLIIIGAAYVSDQGKIMPRAQGISADRHISGLKRLVQAVHKQNTKIAIQLGHAGARSPLSLIGGRPVAPSSLPFPDLREPPRELEKGEIQDLVAAFGAAARRAREAGFDAIELHGSAAGLLHQFISPYSNHRTDEYGGSFQKRMRFPLEILRQIREEAGTDLPVGCRIPHDEIVAGGLTLEDTHAIAVELVNAGLDFVRVVVGVAPPIGREDSQRTSTARPEGQLPALSADMKRAVSVPVIATGGIRTAEQAEKLLRDGSADLVAVGTPLLADPYWLAHSPRYVQVYPGLGYCPECSRKVDM